MERWKVKTGDREPFFSVAPKINIAWCEEKTRRRPFGIGINQSFKQFKQSLWLGWVGT
jgi:hypothetical protein